MRMGRRYEKSEWMGEEGGTGFGTGQVKRTLTTFSSDRTNGVFVMRPPSKLYVTREISTIGSLARANGEAASHRSVKYKH